MKLRVVASLLLILSLELPGALRSDRSIHSIAVARAQTSDWCPAAGDSAQGCAEVRLSPANLSGDFYLGDTLLASAQNMGHLIVPPGPRAISVRHIHSTEMYFGSLFIYPDTTTNINTAPGQVLHTVVYPRRQYVRGLLTVTCDVRGATSTDDLGCLVSIDGAEQSGRIVPGAFERYVVDAGSHTVSVTLLGASADFWSPGSSHRSISIVVGQRAYFSPRFVKKGLLTLTLSQPTARADFYVNGELAAQQAATAEAWVDADQGHVVEVQNVTDTASDGVYGWQNARQIAFVSTGQTRAVRFWLRKHYFKGFFELTCLIGGLPDGQSGSCRPVIDGTEFRHVAGGRSASFVLPPGTHTVTVTAAPEGIWTRAEPYTWEVTIREGGIVRRTAAWRAAAAPDSGAPPAAAQVIFGFAEFDWSP